MDRAALDAAYNNGAAVAKSAEIVADWRRRSEALRGNAKELRYGPAERNRIDYLEAAPGAPLLVFIHGGYWQAREKELFAFLAAGPLAQGISVALVGYTLAPEKRLDGIVAEVSAALDFLARPLVVSGWSAGGHLTAMMMRHPNARAGLAISGIFDLEPMRLCYINEKLRLDEEEARRNSPMLFAKADKELLVSVGTAELPELQRQSRAYAAKLGHRLLALPGHDHFTILEELASPSGALTGAVRGLADRL